VLWNFNGMIMIGEIPCTRRKTCISATLSTTNPTLIGLGLNPCTRVSKLETNSMEHGMALLLQCMNACTHIRTYGLYMCIYAYIYMCMHAYSHAVASTIVSSYVLFPLQKPFIKSSCIELIHVSDQKNTHKVNMIVLM